MEFLARQKTTTRELIASLKLNKKKTMIACELFNTLKDEAATILTKQLAKIPAKDFNNGNFEQNEILSIYYALDNNNWRM